MIVRVYRDGHRLTDERANEGLVDTDTVEVAPVPGERDGRLRVACATKLIRAHELGEGEGWIDEGKLWGGVLHERPSRYARAQLPD